MSSFFPAVLAAALVWAVAVTIYPHLVDYDDDHGDGRGVVLLPKPVSSIHYRMRLFAFFGIGATIILFADGLHRFQPATLYTGMVRDVATSLTGRSAEVVAYVQGVSPRIPLLWTVALLSFACVLRATWGRRIAVMAHALLYLTIAIILQSAVIAACITFNLPFRPSTAATLVINLFAGLLVAMRMVLTTFQLPRANTLLRTRRFNLWDSLVMWCYLIVGLAIPVVALSWVDSPAMAGSEWRRFVPLFAFTLFSGASGVGLLVLRGPRPNLPQPLGEPPPIDVITPAWNEAAGIALTLTSVDEAAARYGGRVRAIVSNDGSTDETVAIARRTMEGFRHAEGVIVSHPNTGKAGALNRALAEARSDVVVRLDGDCVMHPDALKYTAPWFENPETGIVGSLMLPREDCRTWYSKMRGIECLLGFGCTRMGQQVVDGVGTVPGTYTAFRRQPMIDSGGFVEGMNGEDSDQTCQFGRMGYRVVIDPRVVCYEDVPANATEFIEQRTRWARANIHVFARHDPIRNGLAGPRVWFYMFRRGIMWAQVPLILLAPLYFILALGGLISHSSAVFLLTIPSILAAFWFTILVGAAFRYRYWHVVPWLPTYLAFGYLRRIALMEAMLSLPSRPLRKRQDLADQVLPARPDHVEPDVQRVEPSRRLEPV